MRTDAPARGLARVGGAVLARATQAVAALRPARKPLHPHGDVFDAVLERRGSPTTTGVAWLDSPGEDAVLLRLSRAVGLPDRVPDIHGLAMRVLDPPGAAPGFADVLLASTWPGRWGRFVLSAARKPGARPLTSLLPYRSPTGPLWLRAERQPSGDYSLAWAGRQDHWQVFGTLRPKTDHHGDQEISFDPVCNLIPGLEQYAAIKRLREPAYARARLSRS